MKTLILKQENNIARVIFNRPKFLNAYDWQMSLELPELMETLAEDPNIKIIILEGAGGVFMAGGDINLLKQAVTSSDDLTRASIAALNTTVDTILNMNKLVIAKVEGAVAGAGISLMLACDFAIVSDETKFNLAYLNLGLSPDGGMTYFLPRLIGMKKSLELLLLNKPFGANKALQLGLINKLFTANNLEAETMRLVGKLLSGPFGAQIKVKHLLQKSWHNNLTNQLAMETDNFVECTNTDDFKSGVAAFLQKQTPVFNN